MKQNKTYLHLGVTLIASACAVLVFYDTFFQSRVLLDFFDKLMSVLSPVIYGLVFAYLLAPIVDFFDRYIQKGLPKVKSSLVRGLSILVTWICVIALIYLMFSILIPELVDSTKTLADNFESYYKTVYNWVNSLVENQTIFSDDIYSDQLLSALNGYYGHRHGHPAGAGRHRRRDGRHLERHYLPQEFAHRHDDLGVSARAQGELCQAVEENSLRDPA